MQSDGANNYDCTAFMSCVQRVCAAAGLRLVRHVVTEVGDGKNLVDQDFQTAQQDMNHARAGGMDLLNAQNIIDALETGRALGVLNMGMDLGTRALEPKKNPTALRGIDLLYDRAYEYDEDGNFLGVRVFQFFRLGAGRLVTVDELAKLWNVEFNAGAIQPKLLQPSSGERATEAKTKLSQTHNLERFAAKRGKANARAQRQAAGASSAVDGAPSLVYTPPHTHTGELQALAAEVRRQQEAKTTRCKFVERGCRHHPFLNRSRASAHEARCCFNPLHETAARTATVRMQVQVGGVVRLSLTGSGQVGQRGGGAVHASLSLIPHVLSLAAAPVRLSLTGSGRVGQHGGGAGHASLSLIAHVSAAARVTLSTRRPALGQAYGLQPHHAVHVLSTAEAKRDAEATQSQAVVSVTLLCVEASGSSRVCLVLRPRCLEMRERGWAIRPPPSTERYSAERIGYLRELYDWPHGRLNEHQAYDLFKQRFKSSDGPYRCEQ